MMTVLTLSPTKLLAPTVSVLDKDKEETALTLDLATLDYTATVLP
jgi:hypothetical protein